jgi:hypothetical protein
MAVLRSVLDKIHEQNLPGTPFTTPRGFPAWKVAGTRQARLFNGRALMPLAFMKHAQSSTVLEDWQAEHSTVHADEPVNKKGQSLIGRCGAHLVDRYSESAKKKGPRCHSVSIEKKRVTFLNRAIEYIRQAPESECQDLLERLSKWDITEATSSELELERRKWGPPPCPRP